MRIRNVSKVEVCRADGNPYIYSPGSGFPPDHRNTTIGRITFSDLLEEGESGYIRFYDKDGEEFALISTNARNIEMIVF